MRRFVSLGSVAILAILFPMNTGAAEQGAGCVANAENARYQLQKASGDPEKALQDWLHYCAPDSDLVWTYTYEIEQAKRSAPVQAPAQKKAPEPFGTFAQSGRMNFDDRSGWFEWNDMLVIRKDGTAEMKTKYKVNLNPGWYLTGCGEDSRAGSDVWLQKFTIKIDGPTVTLKRQGPVEVSRVEPACWEHAEDFQDPWVLDWRDGHLKNKDGEYFKQD